MKEYSRIVQLADRLAELQKILRFHPKHLKSYDDMKSEYDAKEKEIGELVAGLKKK